MELPAIRRAAGRRVQIEIWQYPAEPPVICRVDDGGDDDLLPPMLPADALALYLTVAGAGAAASALTDAAPAWMGRDSRQRRERRRGRRGPTTTPAMPDTTTRRTRGA